MEWVGVEVVSKQAEGATPHARCYMGANALLRVQPLLLQL